jgi:hypothetical protein
MNLRILFPVIIIAGLLSCKNERNTKSRGPIVLGDSSTIVTETNTALLQDQVPDLKPVLSSDEDGTSTPTDTTRAQTVSPETANAANGATPQGGLVAAFKEVTLNIPGITTRSYGKADLQKARGATYELTGGNLNGAQLRISGGQVNKVSQRYQTMLMLKDGSDKLVLESLPKYTSDWEVLNGSGGVYKISGLNANELEYKMPSANAIRNAVQQAARRGRLNRQDTKDWLDAVRNLRSPNQAPAAVVLRSVMWRVEGKGFNKELRIDVPVQ